jgi:hypothetical protein
MQRFKDNEHEHGANADGVDRSENDDARRHCVSGRETRSQAPKRNREAVLGFRLGSVEIGPANWRATELQVGRSV